MDSIISKNYSKITKFEVSRETCNELESLISMIQKKNKEINIISRKNSDQGVIRQRHIVDSAQIIDFVDLNNNTTSDLGSGGGIPGLIIAILMKKLKNSMKIKLYEKSHHKCVFLKDVSEKLELNTEIIQKDIFKLRDIETGTIMSRAFKPMPIILDLVQKNFRKYKNIILFMGKSGRKILNETLKIWDLDYEEKKSLTNKDSFLLNIKNMEKLIKVDSSKIVKVFGVSDSNLKLIQSEFLTTITYRDDTIFIRGESEQVKSVFNTFKEIIYVLKNKS